MIAGTRRLGLLIGLVLTAAALCCGGLPLVAQTPGAAEQGQDAVYPDPASGQKGEAPSKRINWPSASQAQAKNKADAAAQGGPAEHSKNAAGKAVTAPSAAAGNGDAQPQAQGQSAPPSAPVGGGPAAGPEAKPETKGEQADTPQGGAPAPPVAPSVVPELPADIATGLKQSQGLASQIEALEKTVERVKDRDKELIEQLSAIEGVIVAAQRHANELKPKLDDVRLQISRLGPVPDGKDVPPESASIAAQRARLNSVAAEIDGAIKQAALVEVRARQLAGRVQELRQEIFTRDLMRRSRSPLTPVFWQEIWHAVPSTTLQVKAIAAGWWSTALPQLHWVIALVIGSLALYLALKAATRRILRTLRAQVPDPRFFLKVSLAGAQGPLRALPSLAAAVTLYLGLDALGLMYLQVGYLATRVLEAFITYKLASSLTKAYLQPSLPAWRVLELNDDVARRLTRLIKLVATVYAVDLVAREVTRLLYLPLPANILTTLISSLAFAVLFALIARTRFSLSVGNDSAMARLRAELLKVPLLVAALAITIAVIVGYVALARYIGLQVLSTGSAIILLSMLYLANRAIAVEPDENPGAQAAAADPHGLSIEVRRRLAGATAVVLDGILVVIAVPVLLISIGFSSADIGSLANRALFGFEIGGVQISLLRIGIALAIFAVLLVVTRMLRRWLTETVLHPRRVEEGLSNSISTGITYLGTGIAALAAISYAGLDITNIALVAGALSVGIGFGLQSIVNNFVSGLILLVERPIKVGDRINVAGQAGHVRRISVRSTEIETFDRASVIIPNSELIAGTVVNLTHRNAMGRLTIPVCVSYGADPERVMAVLMEIAENSTLVAKHPAPFVAFDNFGEKGFEFSLFVHVIDVSRSGVTTNELRLAIVKRFREEGFSFPFPQRDLHLREFDGLKALGGKLVGQGRPPSASDDNESGAPIA